MVLYILSKFVGECKNMNNYEQTLNKSNKIKAEGLVLMMTLIIINSGICEQFIWTTPVYQGAIIILITSTYIQARMCACSLYLEKNNITILGLAFIGMFCLYNATSITTILLKQNIGIQSFLTRIISPFVVAILFIVQGIIMYISKIRWVKSQQEDTQNIV